jgi:hypothetical protein
MKVSFPGLDIQCDGARAHSLLHAFHYMAITLYSSEEEEEGGSDSLDYWYLTLWKAENEPRGFGGGAAERKKERSNLILEMEQASFYSIPRKKRKGCTGYYLRSCSRDCVLPLFVRVVLIVQ